MTHIREEEYHTYETEFVKCHLLDFHGAHPVAHSTTIVDYMLVEVMNIFNHFVSLVLTVHQMLAAGMFDVAEHFYLIWAYQTCHVKHLSFCLSVCLSINILHRLFLLAQFSTDFSSVYYI